MYQKVTRQVKMYCNLVHCLYIFNAYERKHSGHLKCTLTLTCSLFTILIMYATVIATHYKQQKQKISGDVMLFLN